MSPSGRISKTELRVTLLGRFAAHFGPKAVLGNDPRKVQELFAYLLLNRNRAHPRGELAELLWPESEQPKPRTYLRQALWRLQGTLHGLGRPVSTLVEQENDWVQARVTSRSGVWVDTLAFEGAYRAQRAGRSPSLEPVDAQALVDAVALYRGELLLGWSRPWCQPERDRFEVMYLRMLDRLVGHFESTGEWEPAIGYANLVLRCDPANEQTHRTLMRLLNRSGDRTGALRQFERCRQALREELDVEPSRETVALSEQIRGGKGVGS